MAAIAYGMLAIAGGILGYVKSKSKVSIISGSMSGALLIASAIAQLQGISGARIASIAIAGALVVIFAVRLVKTRKFMPAGLMIIAGVVTLVIVVLPGT
jgi:uncharacterized membrane protein (UPF0136 family)